MSRHEDVTEQVDRLTNAGLELRARLADLAAEAKRASKAAKPLLDDIYARVSAVRRAEEAVDMATMDLATARGEDA